MEAYRLPGAIGSTENPNFSPSEFVRGAAGGWRGWNPDRWSERDKQIGRWAPHVVSPDRLPTGRYDTVYITASADRQEFVAPLVVGLLAQIQAAALELHRADQAANYFDRQPVVWALDEMAGMAPLRDLPRTLSVAGGQNLLVAGCLQDLSMAKARWGVESEGFPTLFGEVLVFRGIRHIQTLEALFALAGKTWLRKESRSWGGGTGGSSGSSTSWNTSQQEVQVDVLTPAEIYQGNPYDPDAVLTYRPWGLSQVRSMPYYRIAPWPQVLTLSMRHLLGQPWADARHELAPPILTRDTRSLWAVGGDAIVEDFTSWSRALGERGEHARKLRATRDRHRAMVDYDDSHGPTLPSWFQRVRRAPGAELSEIDSVLAELGARVGTDGDAESWDESRSDRTLRPTWVLESCGSRMLVTPVTGPEAAAFELQWRAQLTPDELAQVGSRSVVLRVSFVDRPGSHMAASLYQELLDRWPAAGATPRLPGWIEPEDQESPVPA